MSDVKAEPGTGLGGGRRDFPSTCWSQILDSPKSDGRSWETLAQAYWKPVYWYIRVRWAKSNEDAKDLTQDFFFWMMESGFAGKADPSRGRFRSFLKLALNHHLSQDKRDHDRLKRGGGRAIVSLDGHSPDVPGWELLNPEARTPEEVMDEAWKAELLGRATELLEDACRREGREIDASLFRDYYLPESEEPDYQRVATKHGITTTDVANRLRRARARFREIVRQLVAETVQGPEDLREEMGALFGENAP